MAPSGARAVHPVVHQQVMKLTEAQKTTSPFRQKLINKWTNATSIRIPEHPKGILYHPNMAPCAHAGGCQGPEEESRLSLLSVVMHPSLQPTYVLCQSTQMHFKCAVTHWSTAACFAHQHRKQQRQRLLPVKAALVCCKRLDVTPAGSRSQH